MRPGGGRAKGHDWERAVAIMLRPVFGDVVRRGLSQCRSGAEEPDVMLPKGVPFWIECKACARVNVQAAIRQASEAIGSRPLMPVVASKDNRCKPLATMYLEDWIALMTLVTKEKGRTLESDPCELLVESTDPCSPGTAQSPPGPRQTP